MMSEITPRHVDSPPAPDESADAARNDFANQAEAPQRGLFVELLSFLTDSAAWWLTPIIIVLLLVAIFVFITGAAGPFIYPLF